MTNPDLHLGGHAALLAAALSLAAMAAEEGLSEPRPAVSRRPGRPTAARPASDRDHRPVRGAASHPNRAEGLEVA